MCRVNGIPPFPRKNASTSWGVSFPLTMDDRRLERQWSSKFFQKVQKMRRLIREKPPRQRLVPRRKPSSRIVSSGLHATYGAICPRKISCSSPRVEEENWKLCTTANFRPRALAKTTSSSDSWTEQCKWFLYQNMFSPFSSANLIREAWAKGSPQWRRHHMRLLLGENTGATPTNESWMEDFWSNFTRFPIAPDNMGNLDRSMPRKHWKMPMFRHPSTSDDAYSDLLFLKHTQKAFLMIIPGVWGIPA